MTENEIRTVLYGAIPSAEKNVEIYCAKKDVYFIQFKDMILESPFTFNKYGNPEFLICQFRKMYMSKLRTYQVKYNPETLNLEIIHDFVWVGRKLALRAEAFNFSIDFDKPIAVKGYFFYKSLGELIFHIKMFYYSCVSYRNLEKIMDNQMRVLQVELD